MYRALLGICDPFYADVYWTGAQRSHTKWTGVTVSGKYTVISIQVRHAFPYWH